MPALNKHPAVVVKIHVAFSLHTFTRKIMADDADNRETRCSCRERYKYDCLWAIVDGPVSLAP
jgi:hypothetical protein